MTAIGSHRPRLSNALLLQTGSHAMPWLAKTKCYPRTGNLKETSQKFSFKGDGQKLKNVMAAMGDFLQSSVAGVRK